MPKDSRSTWVATAGDLRAYPSLAGDEVCDVAVVGSGLTGITAAYLLGKAGKNVVLITDEAITESATAYTTGFLTMELDTALVDLRTMFGDAGAKRLWQAQKDAIDAIEKTIREEGIECEFMRCPHFSYARTEDEWKAIQEEAAAARDLGFDVEARRDGSLPFPNRGYMCTMDQAKYHALKYASALKERSIGYGVKAYDHTMAEEIVADGDVRLVRTPRGTIRARDVVVATYYPFTKPAALFAHTGGYTTYIIEFELPSGLIPEAMYQDDHNPYHYFRVDRMSDTTDRLIVGGEDHREEVKMDEEKNYRAIHEFIAEIIPSARLSEVRRWSGPIIEPIDGLPFIGSLASDRQQLVATGYSGTGMTWSRLAAEIMRDYVIGEGNPYTDLFDPARVPSVTQLAIKGRDYTGELIGGGFRNIFRK